jgi:hypothetical protein
MMADIHQHAALHLTCTVKYHVRQFRNTRVMHPGAQYFECSMFVCNLWPVPSAVLPRFRIVNFGLGWPTTGAVLLVARY